jgi:hypothetical protein
LLGWTQTLPKAGPIEPICIAPTGNICGEAAADRAETDRLAGNLFTLKTGIAGLPDSRFTGIAAKTASG